MPDMNQLGFDCVTFENNITKCALPEQFKLLQNNFRLQVKALRLRYYGSPTENQKILHFCALYQITRMHQEMMEEEHEQSQSSSSYLSSFVQTSAEKQYLELLDQFLTQHYMHNQELCLGEFSNSIIEHRGHDEALSYELGPDLHNENRAPAQTSSQFSRRLFALNYFKTLESSLSEQKNKIFYTAAAGNAALLLVSPPLVLWSAACTIAGLPSVKGSIDKQQRSLQRIGFKDLLAEWKTQIHAILTVKHAAQEAYDLLDQPNAKNHAKME